MSLSSFQNLEKKKEASVLMTMRSFILSAPILPRIIDIAEVWLIALVPKTITFMFGIVQRAYSSPEISHFVRKPIIRENVEKLSK